MRYFILIILAATTIAQGHFESVDPTGIPYVIVFSNSEVTDAILEEGMEIGIFAGDLCVGVDIYDGSENFPITSWEGDDGLGLPGFSYGEEISFRIWLSQSEIEVVGQDNFIQGNGTFGYGSYSIVELVLEIESDFISGDVNLDNDLNIFDIILMVEWILINPLLENYIILVADMNQDGIIDIIDVIILVESIIYA